MTVTTGISRDQVDAFTRDGFLFPFRAMSTEQATEFRAKLEAFEAEYGDRAGDILRSKAHLALTWVQDLIRLDPVLDVIEGILGPDIYVWGSSFFIKEPHNPKFIAWHQDAPFSAIPPGAEFITAWIALAPSTLGNGCLKVVKGTHTEMAEHKFTNDDSNMLSQGQEIAVEVNEADATAIQLEPGEFSLHHQFMFHGSGPSTSDERRIGLAVRYMRPFPRVDNQKLAATLVRGEDRHDTFTNEPVPVSDMAPDAVQYLEDQLKARHGDRYRK
ncbi:phytanoyl-CoA dioxygenase family protein (plasmid) [Arthrobacter sp. zg-Y820]|uniref:phytanoyl-CoA dioxygenase family protein n=1 Tax=unclassified Arthrobacter TaxID=235627 RepID=UPI001E59159F|nr:MULTISPECIES: phytanoyl-CoA dioxygenase family protein [unclassified Arthrobacter]MCC9198508.1 phytanoyl-CoA dioxygenase family protein [Arthrobacter sp. zg-Y820]MDK1281378.1 phytanoyl-CoA dioxygenase family protein [Arthrobacter sp. zg.Y820]WIB11230.1 phytanoyl-CoA dioxygenase family protein [Arthrobacter sp. zg-Y820]